MLSFICFQSRLQVPIYITSMPKPMECNNALSSSLSYNNNMFIVVFAITVVGTKEEKKKKQREGRTNTYILRLYDGDIQPQMQIYCIRINYMASYMRIRMNISTSVQNKFERLQQGIDIHKIQGRKYHTTLYNMHSHFKSIV